MAAEKSTTPMMETQRKPEYNFFENPNDFKMEYPQNGKELKFNEY